MIKEELIACARHRIKQKSQERHFSDESVLNMKRAYEIKCERYESKIKELEAQIEKMKCCYNCKHSRTDYVHCITDKHENWEMIEND